MLISDSLVMDGAHMTIGEQNVLTQNTAGTQPAARTIRVYDIYLIAKWLSAPGFFILFKCQMRRLFQRSNQIDYNLHFNDKHTFREFGSIEGQMCEPSSDRRLWLVALVGICAG